jgi:hypothetical protein
MGSFPSELVYKMEQVLLHGPLKNWQKREKERMTALFKIKPLLLIALGLFTIAAFASSVSTIGRLGIAMVGLILLTGTASREQPGIVTAFGVLAAVCIVTSNLHRHRFGFICSWIAVVALIPVAFSNQLFSESKKNRRPKLQIVRGKRRPSS